MEFDPEQVVPPAVEAQFNRISRNIGAEWGDQAALVASQPERFPDVETFLAKNAGVFGTVDELWQEVDQRKGVIQKKAEVIRIPSNSRLAEDGTVHFELVDIDEGNSSRGFRRYSQDKLFDWRLYIAKLNRIAHEEAADLLATGLLHSVLETDLSNEDINEFLGSYMSLKGRIHEKLKSEAPAKRRALVAHGSSVDELRTLGDDILDAYLRAFIVQNIGIHRIQTLLADDGLVLPFAERLEALITSAKHGGQPEFPGLLETIQVHIAEARIAKKPNHLQTALDRVAKVVTTKEQFIASLITNPDAARELSGSPRELIAGIAAVQAVARIVTMGDETGITIDDIAQRVSEHFELMPAEWQKAYGTAASSKTKNIWLGLHTPLRSFERQGRLVSNIKERPSNGPQPPSKSPKKKPGKRTPVDQGESVRNIEDMSAERDVAPPIGSFSILKSTGSSSNAVFTIERVPDLDTLMGHSVIAKFLKDRTDLTPDVRLFLEQIAKNPYSGATEILGSRPSIRINDTKTANAAYPMRRYSPRRDTIEGGTSHPHANRVRIKFCIIVVDGKNCLAIEDIELRSTSTF